MENYALIARQEEQIKALKTENDYLKKVRNPTEIENANLRQKNDALELENKSLQSEIQVMTAIRNSRVARFEPNLEVAEYALVARQEKQIKALKTENDYLKKVRNPTEIENANLRQKNDALELENKSLQSEIQVMTEKHNLKVEELESDLEVAELDVESAKSRNLEFNRREKFRLRKMACISVVVVLLVSVVIYGLGHSNGYKNASNYLQKSSNKILNENKNENKDNIQLGKVINYLFEPKNSSGIIVYPTTVSRATGVDYNDVLLILLKLEKHGVVTKSQFPQVGRQPQFQLR